MTIREVYRVIREASEKKTDEHEATAIARVVMESVMSMQPADLIIRGCEEIPHSKLLKLSEIATRLREGEPVQYILGEAWFHGLKLHVAPGVLIPRPETSQLVDLLTDMVGERTDLRIIDLGTGSGAIAISLARALRFPQITAVDISAQAVEIARNNAVNLSVDIDFIEGDMLKAETLPEGSWDIVVSNPPYIEPAEMSAMEKRVLDYEPHIALFTPKDDPLCFYRAVAGYAFSTLRQGGILAFEINPDYADELEMMLRKTGFSDVHTLRDFCGRLRFSISRL